jgi:uncharacterized phage protein (TIGR02218 family)
MSLTSTTLTQLWTLTAGSSIIRRTTFDQPLVFGGNTYTPAPLQPSTFDEHQDLTPNQIEISINLENSGITEAALMGRTWDRARLLIQAVDWTSLATPAVRKWKGALAHAVVINGQLSRCEFLALSYLISSQPIGYLYSPLCDAEEYGGTRCGKDVSAETFTGTVTAVVDGANFTVNITQAEADYFQFGPCDFTTGLNAGADRLEIKSSTPSGGNTVLELVQDFPFTVQVGDAVTLVRGCNREFETCKARANALRFRGQPNIPGLDKLLKRFPE